MTNVSVVLRGYNAVDAAEYWPRILQQTLSIAGRFKNLALYLGLPETCCENLRVKRYASKQAQDQDREALADPHEAVSLAPSFFAHESTLNVTGFLDLDGTDLDVEGLDLDFENIDLNFAKGTLLPKAGMFDFKAGILDISDVILTEDLPVESQLDLEMDVVDLEW